jgi:hypothetical protein
MNLNHSSKLILLVLLAAQNFPAVAQNTNALAPADYPKFIAQRNIFDPDRYPYVPGSPPRPRPVVNSPPRQTDSFSLVGIIGYGEGRQAGVYAFFDGSSLQYRKSAQVNDGIAGFKVADIAANSVTLASGTNTLVLGIGEQLHDDGSGRWVFANGTTSNYSSGGYAFGNSRYSGRSGYRRNNNFGNYNNGNSAGNFNNGNFRGRNNFPPSSATDASQITDPNQNPQDDNSLPNANIIVIPSDDTMPPDNMGSPDDNTPPDTGAPDNTAAPQTEPPAATPN